MDVKEALRLIEIHAINYNLTGNQLHRIFCAGVGAQWVLCPSWNDQEPLIITSLPTGKE